MMKMMVKDQQIDLIVMILVNEEVSLFEIKLENISISHLKIDRNGRHNDENDSQRPTNGGFNRGGNFGNLGSKFDRNEMREYLFFSL